MKKVKNENKNKKSNKKVALYIAEGLCLVLCVAGVIGYREYQSRQREEAERIERQEAQEQAYDDAKQYIEEQTGVPAEDLTVVPAGYMRLHRLENGDYEITMEQRGEDEIEAEFYSQNAKKSED